MDFGYAIEFLVAVSGYSARDLIRWLSKRAGRVGRPGLLTVSADAVTFLPFTRRPGEPDFYWLPRS